MTACMVSVVSITIFSARFQVIHYLRRTITDVPKLLNKYYVILAGPGRAPVMSHEQTFTTPGRTIASRSQHLTHSNIIIAILYLKQ